MEIKIKTKYNIGDVLYHPTTRWEIIKVTVRRIDIRVDKDNKLLVMYKFSNDDTVHEDYLYDYLDTPEKAGQYIARAAIEKMMDKISEK